MFAMVLLNSLHLSGHVLAERSFGFAFDERHDASLVWVLDQNSTSSHACG
jgi:hypothetical protein